MEKNKKIYILNILYQLYPKKEKVLFVLYVMSLNFYLLKINIAHML